MMYDKSEKTDEIYAALSKAQSEMRGAVKDSSNPYFKSKYADLSSVWEACQVPLTNNGLSVTQTIGVGSQVVGNVLITTLGHSSGQWITSVCPINPSKQNDPQSFGACVTYMRRFSLAAMVCVCPEDDDAEKERKEIEKKNMQEYERKKLGVVPTEKEVEELNAILMQCPREYVAKMLDGRTQRGWSSFLEMPLNAFNSLKSDAFSQVKAKEKPTSMDEKEKYEL